MSVLQQPELPPDVSVLQQPMLFGRIFHYCFRSTAIIGQTPPGTVHTAVEQRHQTCLGTAQTAVKQDIQAQHSLLQYRTDTRPGEAQAAVNHTCPLSTVQGQQKLL